MSKKDMSNRSTEYAVIWGIRMSDYRWRCMACELGNEADEKRCVRCGCPASPQDTEIEAHKAQYLALQGRKYECAKCGFGEYKAGEMRGSGGILSSFLEVETEKFSFVSCAKCGYTEFYRGKASTLRNIGDFLS